jgi:hypothetical protein
MDPITLATITSGVTVLATEVSKSVAGEAGKDLWKRVKSTLGWKADKPAEEIAPAVAQLLQNNDALAKQIVELLQQTPSAGSASLLVGSVKGGKVIVAQTINVQGGFKM